MKNKFKLHRTIPKGVKYAVRKRCGFGCVICGQAIIQYHHFDPPFSEAKTHNPEGITLLCATHHDMAGRNIISPSKVAAANALPKCKESAAHSQLFLGSKVSSVKIGSSTINARTILMYEDEIVLGFNEPEDQDSPARLNAMITDGEENIILDIRNNEWIIGQDCFDVLITMARLVIRNKQNHVALEMALDGEQKVEIHRMDMLCNRFKIFADNESFVLETPSGARFKHAGSTFGEIGIWMKSNGAAQIATNRSGGAAIYIAPPP